MEAVFPSNKSVFLNEFFIPASGNNIVYLKQYYFIIFWGFFLFAATGESNFWKITLFLQIKTDFLAGVNHLIFFHFETLQLLLAVFFRQECKHIFKHILVNGKRFSG